MKMVDVNFVSKKEAKGTLIDSSYANSNSSTPLTS